MLPACVGVGRFEMLRNAAAATMSHCVVRSSDRVARLIWVGRRSLKWGPQLFAGPFVAGGTIKLGVVFRIDGSGRRRHTPG